MSQTTSQTEAWISDHVDKVKNASPHQLLDLLDYVPVLIGYMDVELRYRFVSQAYADFCGVAQDSLIGRAISEVPQAWDLFQAQPHLKSALAGKKATFESEFTYSSGPSRDVIVHLVPDGGSSGLRGLLFLIEDVTDGRRVERAGRDSEQRFRATFENAGVGMAHIGLRGEWLRLNRKFCAILGYGHDELLGRSLQDVIHPDDLATDAELCESLLGGQIQDYSLRKRYVHADGHPVWVQITRALQRSTDGSPEYFILVACDITNQALAEERLKELNCTLEERVAERTKELERRNKELDDFAYLASHDLKAPLRAIDNLARWIAEDAADVLSNRSKQHLTKMQRRVQRMERLLADLLEYSRATRVTGNVVKVSTGSIVHTIRDLLDVPKGFRIVVAAGMPAIVTARVPLEQCLCNLVGNAIKHHHRNQGRIEVSCQDAGDFVEFSISDNGPGIAPEYHGRIFQMFETLHPRDQVEGSGIGLAVVRKIVEHYGGSIHVDSAEGRGTTFRFTWPKELKR